MPPEVRVRFAPSPTGHLHVGNARTALFNWLYARGRGGAFILRIEDTDLERSTARSEEGILEDLRWLGLDHDEGPGIGGRFAPYRQSERRQRYGAAALRLQQAGDAYRCFCSVQELELERETQRAAGLPPRYAGRCRDVSSSESDRRAAVEPFVLRFRVAADRVAFDDLIRGHVEFPGTQIGDPVIVRADGTPTYNFAVVIDDLDMEITHVIRGEDHISNTPRQILLYRALGAAPPLFAHLSLVLGPDGSPLSKRHGASSVVDFREKGILPEALVNYLSLLGWAHPEGKELLAVDELIRAFSLERVGHAAAMFDMKKLAWLNAHYLRAAAPARLASDCRPALAAADFVPAAAGSTSLEDWIGRALQTYAGQMETL
ncbi:MAG TPA: glutamate--tRNA ligase, partial [Patescibacteria group bacterium]|nr:glutamate--tRNA ligase [Patescibacteria group bacterium]